MNQLEVLERCGPDGLDFLKRALEIQKSHENDGYMAPVHVCQAVYQSLTKVDDQTWQCLSCEAMLDGIPMWGGFRLDALGYGRQYSLAQGLIRMGILEEAYHSRSTTEYRLKDIAMVEGLLGEGVDASVPLSSLPDIFDIIVGHDDIKTLFRWIFEAESPVHVLLLGPPATAKSLFLSELERLPGSAMVLGSALSRRGITEVLIQSRPKYLLVDEIDKASPTDLNILLRLMVDGVLQVDKSAFHIYEKLDTFVFAAANDDRHIAKELCSRFLQYYLPEYTDAEFAAVVQRVLTMREGKSVEVAQAIALGLQGFTRDVREAVRVARMAKSLRDIKPIIQVLKRGRYATGR